MAGVLGIVESLVQEFFGTTGFNGPTIYIGLSTSTPTATGGSVTEPVGNSYARQPVTQVQWQTLAKGIAAQVITYPTATGNWGTLTYFVMYDALTNGNFLGYGKLDVPLTITSTQVAVFTLSIYTYHAVRNPPGDFIFMRS